MNYIIVIPARFKSSRLPGKPLIKILGKEMLLRTYEQCLKVEKRENIIVATEDQSIEKFCINNNIQVLLTSHDCKTGTDRVAEVAQQIKKQYYINVQGDEPVFNPKDLELLIRNISTFHGAIINGYTEIIDEADFHSPNVPKVVFNSKNDLLYMSRSAIPGNKNNKFFLGFRQVCLYAFPRQALIENFSANQGRKEMLESIEDIEILRFIERGHKVKMIKMSNHSIPVDTSEDILKVEAFLNK
tara:strand:- start:1652 stop:2380 length:729 start_codon:yes stop_codon:yes gene_type:complete